MKYLQAEEAPRLVADARNVIAETYILHFSDRIRLTDLLSKLAVLSSGR